MLRRFFNILLLSLLFFPAWVHAQEPSIQVHVDQDTVSVDDTLTMTVEIHGGSAMTSPDIPSLGHFDVVGRSTSNSVEILNGEMSVNKTFTFVLQPRGPGDFSIGPVKVYIEGKEYSAGPLRVKVTGSQSPPTYVPQNPQPSFPQNPQTPQMPGMPFPWPGNAPGYPQQPQQPAANDKAYQEAFVTAETDRKEAYVGQQILFTFRLYTSVSIQGAQLSLPDFKDFITEELTKERKYEVELGGRRYAVNEWRMALFPTKTGTIETGETKVKGNIAVQVRTSPFDDPFFQGYTVSTRPKVLSAPSIEIKVKDLPPSPKDFTGLIGSFAMSSTLSKDSLNLGETTNLKIEISGKGNIREANLPELQEMDYFKVYPSKPEVKLDKNIQGLSGKKIFEYALVGDRPGTTTIPAQEFSYFNPENGNYEKLSTAPMTVHILGSPSGEKLVTAGLEDSKNFSGDKSNPSFDLLPLKPAGAILYSQALRAVEKTAAWSGLLGAPLVFFAWLAFERQRARSLAHADDRKRSRAFKKARAALQKIGGASEGDLSLVIKNYFGDRFLVKGTALTPLEIEELLQSKGIPLEVTRRTVYFLDQLDQWKYGGMAGQRPSDKQLKQEALDLLREIEKAT